jgi:hypothetical protein
MNIIKQRSFITKLDSYFNKRKELFFFISIASLIIFGLLLFDPGIDEGGDDSGYILNAKNFIEGTAFPGWHGTFYSILIGFVIKLSGFNLLLFKALSLVFLACYQVLIYFSLRNKISSTILCFILLFSGFSSGILFFGSQTYTEALFFLEQGFLFYFLFNFIIEKPNTFEHIKNSWLQYICLGFVFFSLATTRNVGITAIISVILFLLLDKKFRVAVYVILSYMLFSIPYSLYKKYVWGIQKSDMSGQLNEILLKDPYNNGLGKENFSGIVARVIENTKSYLSQIFLNEISFRGNFSDSTNLFVCLIVVSLLIYGLIRAYRTKNKIFQFLFLYLGVTLGTTFISIHAMWKQNRLIIAFLPFLLIALIWAIFELSKFKKLRIVNFLIVVFMGLVLIRLLFFTVKLAQNNQIKITEQIKGNKYYGYENDWVNFLKMSEWAATNIDDSVKIASRKASMSFIFGEGRNFVGIYSVPSFTFKEIDSELNHMDGHTIFFHEKEVNKLPGKYALYIKQFMYCIIHFDNQLYGAYKIPEIEKSNILKLSAFFKINIYEQNNVPLIRKITQAKETICYKPDVLLRRFKEKNVHFVIKASLRINSKVNTGQTITTVLKYLWVIEQKYPGIFSKVHQIGNDKSEPAILYKINYNYYKLKY